MILSIVSLGEHFFFHLCITLETISVVMQISHSFCESLIHSNGRSHHLTDEEILMDLCLPFSVTHNMQFFQANSVYEKVVSE